ncbi:MAG: translation initiation factor IF-3 [Candidatus Sumerlaeota bacterium]
MRTPRRYPKKSKSQNRINDDIRAREVRLIDPDGNKVGIVSIEDALQQARDYGQDLVEVAPNAEPPVCRIINFKTLQYQKQQKRKEAKKHQRQTETKEVKLRPNIGDHDYEVKLKHAREFLEKGNRVKVTLMFRAREMRRYDVGQELMKRMSEDLKDIAVKESPGKGQARSIINMFAPNKEVLERLDREKKQQMDEEE